MSYNFKEFHLSPFYFEANRDGGGANGSGDNSADTNNNQADKGTNNQETFESWLATQPDPIKTKAKALFDAHIEKLQNTVKATREERDDFSRQLRDATSKLAKDSEERKRLEGIADQFDEATRKADFYEEATANNCHNVKAAYAIAKTENLFTKSGAPDWTKIQSVVPEFFGDVKKKLPNKKTAGSGTGDEPATALSMNDWIRAQAGK